MYQHIALYTTALLKHTTLLVAIINMEIIMRMSKNEISKKNIHSKNESKLIHKKWAKLSRKQLDIIDNDLDQLQPELIKAYGYTKNVAQDECDIFFTEMNDKSGWFFY
jgi:hypothetical protein